VRRRDSRPLQPATATLIARLDRRNGFEGGRWDGDHFAYNRAVTNISNTHITNVYNETVINRQPGGAAFNGTGGVQARTTPEQEAAAREKHEKRTAEQTAHFDAAKGNPELRAAANHGKPAVAATAKPGDFKGPGVVQAKAAGPGAEHSAAIRAGGGRAEAKGPAGAKPEAHPLPGRGPKLAPSQFRRSPPPRPRVKSPPLRRSAPRSAAPRPSVLTLPLQPSIRLRTLRHHIELRLTRHLLLMQRRHRSMRVRLDIPRPSPAVRSSSKNSARH